MATSTRSAETRAHLTAENRVASTRKDRARLGIPGYVAMLAAARDKPCSYEDLQRAVGIGRTAVRSLVAALRSARLMHIAGWEERYRAPFAALFAAGAGADAEPPERRANGRPSRGIFEPRRPKPAANVIALAILMRAIDAGPMTIDELAAHTGMAHTTVRNAVDALRHTGMARIADWDERGAMGGRSAARYALGGGTDARPPAKEQRTAINRRYREAKKVRGDQLQALRALAGALSSNAAANRTP